MMKTELLGIAEKQLDIIKSSSNIHGVGSGRGKRRQETSVWFLEPYRNKKVLSLKRTVVSSYPINVNLTKFLYDVWQKNV